MVKSKKILNVCCMFFLLSSATCMMERKTDQAVFDKKESLIGKKICFVGDTGTASEMQKAVAWALLSENCFQIRHLGDIIYPNGIKDYLDKQVEKKFWKIYFNGADAPPIYLTLGNHEYHGNVSSWLKIAQQNPQKIFLPFYYYAEIWQDICFFTLDTTPYNSFWNKFIRPKQERWLMHKMRQLKGRCRLSIVSGHHPFRSSGQHGNASGELKKFLTNNVIGKVDLYIAAHDHNLADEGSEQKTKLLVSGGGGGVLRSIHKLSSPEAFAKSVNGIVTLTFRKKKGVVSANYRIVEVVKRPDLSSPSRVVLRSGDIVGRGLRFTSQ